MVWEQLNAIVCSHLLTFATTGRPITKSPSQKHPIQLQTRRPFNAASSDEQIKNDQKPLYFVKPRRRLPNLCIYIILPSSRSVSIFNLLVAEMARLSASLFMAFFLASAFPASFALPQLPHFFPNVSSIPKSLIPNTTEGVWDGFQKFAGCSPGKRADGLAKLKNYFQYFGYINTSWANFTDDFDDALESAIRTYQLNYNLNVTGELDEPTLKQIVRPRCGVADIINGTSSMNSGKATTSDGHIHAVAHYAFFPGKPRWPDSKRDLTYAFLPGNQLSDEVKAIFGRAFDRWAAIIPMTFTETSSYSSADIQIGFYSGDHGDGEAFDGVLGTLAHAFSPTSGHFHLDLDENWVVDGDVSTASSSSAVDLESVAVHEIGHLLGLGHSSVEEAIMYPTIPSGTKRVELVNDDIQGIQELYGSNPNYNGSSTSTSQERDTSASGPHIVSQSWSRPLLLAVACLFLAVN